MSYLDFDLWIERTPSGGYHLRVSGLPPGREASAAFVSPVSNQELQIFTLRASRDGGPLRGAPQGDSAELEAAKTLGSQLFQAVFAGDTRTCLLDSLEEAQQKKRGLRIRIHLADAPELVDLPWEYLYDPSARRFLNLSSETPVVRYLQSPVPIRPLTLRPPLRLLTVVAKPQGYSGLAAEEEWERLQEAVKPLTTEGLMVAERLDQPTLIALQRRLRQPDFHILHFIGHGAFDRQKQQGIVLMEDESGLARPVPGEYLGMLLHDQHQLRLVVLNACEGARPSQIDPSAGTAQALVQQGIPAVIAMQFEISDRAATTFAHEFYGSVAVGLALDAALTEARRAIFAQVSEIEWGTPVLYMRSPDGHIFSLRRSRESEGTRGQATAPYVNGQAGVVPPDAATAAVTPQARSNADLDPEEAEALMPPVDEPQPPAAAAAVAEPMANALAAPVQAAAVSAPSAGGSRSVVLKHWPILLAIVAIVAIVTGLAVLGFDLRGSAGATAASRPEAPDILSASQPPAAARGVNAAGGPSTPISSATGQANAAANPGASGSGGEIKLAILAPLSGRAPGFGAATRDGALLAIREWNARGGVLGMQILPIVKDSQCDATPAARAANEAIDQDKVHYIVGEVCSGASIAISEVANRKAVVQITPTSTELGVTVDGKGRVKDFIFRACFVDPFQGTAAARFALTDLKAKTAVVMSDPTDSYSKGLADFFSATFTADGGKILDRESYTPQDTDFSATLASIAYLKPDVVYLPDYYAVANLVTRQAKAKGLAIPFLGGDGWDSPKLDRQSAGGDYFTTHYSSDDPRPEVQVFVKKYEAAYPGTTPNALAALAYDATNLMLQGIKDTGVDDATRVKDTLSTIKYNAVTGSMAFNAEHNPVKPAVVMGVTPGGLAFKALVAP
jgi:branched-chain amino acid transport system substrate-binding protein